MSLKKATLLFSLFLLLLTFSLSLVPGHNGDMPFYIACAIEKENSSMEGVVKQTQEILKDELPAREVQDHVDRIGRADPLLFEFYRIKPLYILLIVLFHKMGFSYIHSSILPSLLAYFLLGITLFRFSIQQLDAAKSLLLSTLLILIYPSLVLARLSAPDGLSALILLNAILLIYSGRNKTVWLSLFFLAICVRMDNVVTVLVFLAALWKWPDQKFNNKLSGNGFLISSLFFLGVTIAVNGLSTHHFWWFMNSYFSRSGEQYLKDVILYLLVASGSFLMGFLLLFVITGFRRGFRWEQKANYLFYTLLVIIFVRFLLYPFFEDRFFTAFYLAGTLVIAFQVDAGIRKEANPQKLPV